MRMNSLPEDYTMILRQHYTALQKRTHLDKYDEVLDMDGGADTVFSNLINVSFTAMDETTELIYEFNEKTKLYGNNDPLKQPKDTLGVIISGNLLFILL